MISIYHNHILYENLPETQCKLIFKEWGKGGFNCRGLKEETLWRWVEANIEAFGIERFLLSLRFDMEPEYKGFEYSVCVNTNRFQIEEIAGQG